MVENTKQIKKQNDINYKYKITNRIYGASIFSNFQENVYGWVKLKTKQIKINQTPITPIYLKKVFFSFF